MPKFHSSICNLSHTFDTFLNIILMFFVFLNFQSLVHSDIGK